MQTERASGLWLSARQRRCSPTHSPVHHAPLIISRATSTLVRVQPRAHSPPRRLPFPPSRLQPPYANPTDLEDIDDPELTRAGTQRCEAVLIAEQQLLAAERLLGPRLGGHSRQGKSVLLVVVDLLVSAKNRFWSSVHDGGGDAELQGGCGCGEQLSLGLVRASLARPHIQYAGVDVDLVRW